jgi:uncharacterized protein GlcG (DUF336 family)
MKKSMILALAMLSVSGMAVAQSAAPPTMPPPRAKAPALAPAIVAAQDAIAICKANGFKVTALIVDAANDPVVLLSGDGVATVTQVYAKKKTAAVIKYKMASADVVAKTKTDPAFAAEVKADPNIGIALAGAQPIMSGTELIGAFAISGAHSGDKDDECTVAALKKHPLK